MEKSENLSDNERYEFVVEEIERFKKLIRGHEKLLAAIGNL
jgi:hypothetical protein